MNDHTSKMTNGERARYVQLVELLGEPRSGAEAELLVFMARWLSPADATNLTTLIRRSNGRAAARYAGLLGEVVDRLDERHPASTDDWNVIALPAGLARRLRESVVTP